MGVALIAPNVLEDKFDLPQRKSIWSNCAIEPSLALLSTIGSRLDFAAENNQNNQAESDWLGEVGSGLSLRVSQLVSRPNHGLFSQRAIVQCLKEVIEFGSPGRTHGIDPDNLIRVVLGINYEHHLMPRHPEISDITEVNLEAMRRVEDYFDKIGQDGVDAERAEWMMDEIATRAFERVDSIRALLAQTHDNWRRPWPADTAGPVVGESPADAFCDAMGFDLDDLLALGLQILDRAESGETVFQPEALIAAGADAAAVTFLQNNMSASIPVLKKDLARQNKRHEITQWLRYTLQRFTFVQMHDGGLLLIKPQFFKVRVFGGLIFWDVFTKLGGPDSINAVQFESAMAHVFEIRVGEEFKRMSAAAVPIDSAVCVHETELRRILRTSKNKPSTCDWAIASDSACIVVDANNRPLHQPFAERTGTVEEFRKDIGLNLIGDVPEAEGKNTKFQQLAATISGLRRTGGIPGKFVVDSGTEFVPLVAVPDAGLPYTEFVDHEVISRSKSIPELVTENVLPPALIKLSDIHLLTGLVEQCRTNPFKILRNWRKAVRESPIPIGLAEFILLVEGIPVAPIDKRYLALASRVRQQLEQRNAQRRAH
jgi:hypothetical protein